MRKASGYIPQGIRFGSRVEAEFSVAEMSRRYAGFRRPLSGSSWGARQLLVERGGDLVITGVSLDIKSKLSGNGATKIFKFYNECAPL